MIEKIAQQDARWRKIARGICGKQYSHEADDLVQDMYLRMNECKREEVNDWYIIFCLKNLFLDNRKKFSNRVTSSMEDVKGWEKEHDNECPIESEVQFEMGLRAAKEAFDSSQLHERQIVYYSTVHHIRPFSRDSQISIRWIQKFRNQFKEKAWQKLQEKRPQDLEMLSQELHKLLESNHARDAESVRTGSMSSFLSTASGQ